MFNSFYRDITDIKAYEEALFKEKDNTEKILGSLLPKYVATILKEEGTDKKERQLIAEAYKEVTILFADIVGFTTMASNVSPSELIYILNQIFTSWDTLCEKYHLEKIKTIGGKKSQSLEVLYNF